jgi:hypothetical protein
MYLQRPGLPNILRQITQSPDGMLHAVTSDFIQFFKYTYGTDRLIYLAAQEIVLWRILQRRKTPVSGRGQWILPIQKANTGVWVGHTEGAAKTTRRAQPTGTEATFALQEFHGVWDVSWKMLQDARKDEYSFGRAIEFLDESFRRRTFRLLNADILGYGRGELGILSAADDGDATVLVRSLPLVDLGMIVSLMDASDDNATLGFSGIAVSGINVPTRAITMASGSASSTAAGDYFTVADSVATAGSQHMVGIMAWADTANPATVVGNLGGINRDTAGNEFWRATVMTNSGTLRPLTEDLLLEGMDTTRERGGGVITDLVSNLKIIRRYHENLRSDTFFALQAVEAFGDKVGVGRNQKAMEGGEDSTGETVYQFSGIPWRAEMFMDANKIVGLNREHLFIGHGENEVPQPLSEIFGDDMTPFFTNTANTTFEVVSYFQGELLCDAPTSLVRYDDIAES